MADIFISYSKADRDLADKLATMLEAEGWTVWWDKSLAAGEAYRDEIMKELTVARAVIAIWTKTSVKSDWVRAEAGRAKADGKLIPVMASDLTYSDIPLPFGEMHTENVNARDLLRAAVVGQLAKPQVAPSALWVTTKTVRLQILTWAGIVGGAITLFSNLRGFLTFADWSRWLVTHWQEWNQALWSIVFGWMGMRVWPEFVPLLSFIAFVSMIIFGTARSQMTTSLQAPTERWGASLKRFTKWGLAYVGSLVLIISLFGLVINQVLSADFVARFAQWAHTTALRHALLHNAQYIPLLCWIALAVVRSKERAQTFAMCGFILGFVYLMVISPTVDRVEYLSGKLERQDLVLRATMVSFLIESLSPLFVFAIAFLSPVRLVNRRLLFLSLGALLLASLNQISLLNLHWLFGSLG